MPNISSAWRDNVDSCLKSLSSKAKVICRDFSIEILFLYYMYHTVIITDLIILARLPLVTPSSSSGTGSWRVPRQTATYLVFFIYKNTIFGRCQIYISNSHTGSITLSGSGMVMRSCNQPKLLKCFGESPMVTQKQGLTVWTPQRMGPKILWPNEGPPVFHMLPLYHLRPPLLLYPTFLAPVTSSFHSHPI